MRRALRRAKYRLASVAEDARDTIARAQRDTRTGTPELRVLFVCLGNTCRSPLAERMLRARLEREGLADRVAVASAGTSGRTDGLGANPRARRVARARGLSLHGHRARGVNQEELRAADLVYVFDGTNLAEVRRLGRADARFTGAGEIADPVYGTVADYERAYDAIESGLDSIVDDIRAALPRA